MSITSTDLLDRVFTINEGTTETRKYAVIHKWIPQGNGCDDLVDAASKGQIDTITQIASRPGRKRDALNPISGIRQYVRFFEAKHSWLVLTHVRFPS